MLLLCVAVALLIVTVGVVVVWCCCWLLLLLFCVIVFAPVALLFSHCGVFMFVIISLSLLCSILLFIV